MQKKNKDTYVKVRTTKTLKDNFLKKLEEDGITQSDFFTTCMMNYLDMKTIDKGTKKKNR